MSVVKNSLPGWYDPRKDPRFIDEHVWELMRTRPELTVGEALDMVHQEMKDEPSSTC